MQHSGKMLIKAAGQPVSALVEGSEALGLAGYAVSPLFPARHALPGLLADAVDDHWLIARPAAHLDGNPWDLAHDAAASKGYAVYVEPDLLHGFDPPAPIVSDTLPNSAWPPAGPVNPAWHLLSEFTGFLDVRATATGRAVRIAHLDTGYWPKHRSAPRNVRPELGYNFFEQNTCTVDPGTTGGLNSPGHGTATIAILAGNAVDVIYQGHEFNGDFGGAPDAEVVPVRIGPSVVHFYTSAMAQGLDYVLAPSGDPDVPNPANRCDVVTISHGGLPTGAWADAVNRLYDAGVVVVAASGDNFGPEHFPTRFTVYPSAFNRVITAVGVTYDGTPYVTKNVLGITEMEGNWGPDAVMKKAVAAYTPNLARMEYKTDESFGMGFGGTSAATPQVAAACALWLQLYGARFPLGWQRVEACRLALFKSAKPANGSPSYLGRGVLNVPAMLNPALTQAIEAEFSANQVQPSAKDKVSWFSVIRLLAGAAPANSQQEQMYDAELMGLVYRTENHALAVAMERLANAEAPAMVDVPRLRQLFLQESDMSNALRAALS